MKQLLLSLIFALVALTGLQAQTIWDGTADTSWYNETSTKFEISTAEQLAGLAKLVNNGNNFSGKTILLTADILLNDTSNWENWENSAPNNTWTPIGIWNSFSGTFDGQGYTVSGIYINSENGDQGLFGYNEGTIKNIGVRESYIKGIHYVGGVCGTNDAGTISNCYNSGTVNGNSYVGGVCGENYNGTFSNCYNSGTINGNYYYVGGVCGHNYGTISNCYNSGKVNGSYYVGGVCGYNYGSISDCYNSGKVNGSYYVGGMCGQSYSGTISNCYYLEDTADGGIYGSDKSGQAEVKTAEQFASGEVCWLLNGSSDANPTWFQTINTDDSPVLDNTHGTVYAIGNCPGSIIYNNSGPSHIGEHADNDNDGLCDFCGNIVPMEPKLIDEVYQISNFAELYWFAGLVNGSLDGIGQNTAANAVLTADIIINENVLDANGNLTESTDDLLVWVPMISFSGTFDGQGHTVSGIQGLQGLISYNEGTIKNVGVTNSYIKGYNVGGICGENYGTISNCYNTGNVNGIDFVGGVCGRNGGTISDCYNSGNVSGTGIYVGGVCGYNYYGTISGCYNSGNVSGTRNYVGGVCGYNSYAISGCYNAGNVNGNDYVGGVCGNNSKSSTISNCYNSGKVNGNDDYVGGVCGQSYPGTISNCYYLEGTADGGIYGSDKSGQAEAKTAEQFASGEVCWLLNEEQSEGTWGQKLGTDPCPVLGGPAVFKDGDIYYNEKTTAIEETNNEQASFVIVSENSTINIYGSDDEATVFNLAGNIVYQGSERIIPVPNPGIYMVRIGNEVQKTIVR